MTEKNVIVAAMGGFITDVQVDATYRKLLAAAGGNTQVILALQLEKQGGLCPICDTPYRRSEVAVVECGPCDGTGKVKGSPCRACNGAGSHANLFGKFSYFQPGCHCFKRCIRVPVFKAPHPGDLRPAGYAAGCGRWLVVERLLNIDYCTACNPQGVDRARKGAAKEKRREFRDGKAAAAGEGAEIDL